MINGESRNWIRFQLTLEAFYILYGKWPTVIYLYPFFVNELQEMLSMEDFQSLQSKVKIVPDENNPFLSFDEVGNRFDYARESYPAGHPPIRAIDWLGIHEPTYDD
jgi:hypothetical protein